jgi:hypothetical protein
MARPASRRRREIDPPIPLEGLRFEEVRLKGVETRDELKARIGRDMMESAHRVWRDSILFGMITIGVTILSLSLDCGQARSIRRPTKVGDNSAHDNRFGGSRLPDWQGEQVGLSVES